MGETKFSPENHAKSRNINHNVNRYSITKNKTQQVNDVAVISILYVLFVCHLFFPQIGDVFWPIYYRLKIKICWKHYFLVLLNKYCILTSLTFYFTVTSEQELSWFVRLSTNRALVIFELRTRSHIDRNSTIPNIWYSYVLVSNENVTSATRCRSLNQRIVRIAWSRSFLMVNDIRLFASYYPDERIREYLESHRRGYFLGEKNGR